MCFLNRFKEVLMQGTLNNGLILTVVSSDRPGQAAAYCQLIHQHQPWILATKAPSLILDNSTKQSDSERLTLCRGDSQQAIISRHIKMGLVCCVSPFTINPNHPPASGYNIFLEFKHVPKLCLLLNIYSTLILRI